MGNCLARFTHSLSFISCCKQWIPQRDTQRVKKRAVRTLEESRLSHGMETCYLQCHGYPRWKLHTWFAFPTSRRGTSHRPLICFSHDSNLWVFFFCSVSRSRTQRGFYTVVFLGWPFHCLEWNRKFQTLAGSSGYPPPPPLLLGMILSLVWKIMSHVVHSASSAKTPNSTLPVQKKNIRHSSLFWGHFCG